MLRPSGYSPLTYATIKTSGIVLSIRQGSAMPDGFANAKSRSVAVDAVPTTEIFLHLRRSIFECDLPQILIHRDPQPNFLIQEAGSISTTPADVLRYFRHDFAWP